ncbi:hypothetical protein [Nonomuraea helvata]|uniref:Uncharacterized protein n=1 Tax=Nonomuraea helvata TaxID=37484 RepID=A0ABV5SDJ1_9ACTN
MAALSAGQDLVVGATRPAPGYEDDLVTTAKALPGRAGRGLGLPEPVRAARAGERTGRYRLGGDELPIARRLRR